MILLDSDIMIDLFREYPPAVSWLRTLGEEEIGLPGYVVMELIQGCRNKAEQQEVETRLAGIATLWPTPETCEKALENFTAVSPNIVARQPKNCRTHRNANPNLKPGLSI